MMKKEMVLARLNRAVEERLLCRVHLKKAEYEINCWPLKLSDDMVICALDIDFLINGYGAYPVDRIDRVIIKDDLCREYSRREGLLDEIVVPDVACDSWQALFASLGEKQLVGIERKNAPTGENAFAVGRVVKAGKKKVQLLCVGSDATWEEDVWRIRYRDIVEVTFADRYLTVFGKYVGEPELYEREQGNES